MSVALRWMLVAALPLAACPIPPDNFGDAGPDAGEETDAGVLPDAGSTVPTGTVSCVVNASLANGQSVTPLVASWSATNLAASALALDSSGSFYDAQVSASNTSFGTLTLQFSNLVPGANSGSLTAAAYQPPLGFGVQDTWSCSGGSSACGATISGVSFDGTTLTASFSVQFEVASSGTLSTAASLNSGVVNVTF